MACPVNTKKVLVTLGQFALAHLTEAIADVEYKIQYALTDTVDAPEKLWADLMHNGVPMTLTPDSTPLLLNLPGAYRFIENSPANGTITLATFATARIIPGDVK